MDNFDFNQRRFDSAEGNAFGGQGGSQSFVDLSNPKDVRDAFEPFAGGDQSTISASGQMLFSDPYGAHELGDRHELGSEGSQPLDGSTGQTLSNTEAQIQAQLQQIQIQLQQLSTELAQLISEESGSMSNPQAGSDGSCGPTTSSQGSDTSTNSSPTQAGSDTSTSSSPTQAGSDNFSGSGSSSQGSDSGTGSSITPASGSDGSPSTSGTGSTGDGQGSTSALPVDSSGANFSVSNGQIIGPDGKPFVARGINVDGTISNAEENSILQDFPGLNFIRLATGPSGAPFSGNGTTYTGNDSVAQIQQFIDTMTSHGIVVEVENHNSGIVPTGQDVTTEDNWYSQIASQNKNNPYVWFGTANEPAEVDGNAANIVAEQQGVYSAVRNTGNDNMVMLEPSYYTPSMTDAYTENPELQSWNNVVIDAHFYDANYNQIASDLSSYKGIDSANGQLPIMIGEYGPTTGPGGQSSASTGASEAEAVQQAVNNGLADGASAWALGTDVPGYSADQSWTDTDAIGTPSPGANGTLTPVLTPWGDEVASWIQTGTIGAGNP